MSENIVFGWPRWTQFVTWSGGSWSGTYPLANLSTLPLARVARSTNANLASTQIIGTLDKSRSIQLLGIVRHNLSILAKFRLRLYSDVARTDTIYDSAWQDVWPSSYLPADLEWEDDNWWDGKPLPEDIQGYSPTRPIWLGEQYFARAFLLELDDTTNAAGHVQLGLLEVARGWQVSMVPGRQYSEGFRFRSEALEGLGGGKSFDRRDKPRIVNAAIENLPRDEALSRGFEFFRGADLDQVFMWFPYPDETLHWVRTAFLARLTTPELIARVGFDRSTFPFSLEEVL